MSKATLKELEKELVELLQWARHYIRTPDDYDPMEGDVESLIEALDATLRKLGVKVEEEEEVPDGE